MISPCLPVLQSRGTFGGWRSSTRWCPGGCETGERFHRSYVSGYPGWIQVPVQVLGTLLNKNMSKGDDWWGVRWQLIPESLRCYVLGDIQFGFMTYNVLSRLFLRDGFLDPDVLCRFLSVVRRSRWTGS